MRSETITITKNIAAPKSELYKAWTNEDSLRQWWKPAGNTLQTMEADLKEGGNIIYKFNNGENESTGLTIVGKYKTVLPGEKLVYSWNWLLEDIAIENGTYLLTVEFSGDGEESVIKVSQESTADVEGVHPHQQGWEQALESLSDFISKP